MLHECQTRGRMSDIYGASGFSSLYEYWNQEDEAWIIKQGFRNSMATCIPLNFHEDGVPTFREESYSFWSWMLDCMRKRLNSWSHRLCLVPGALSAGKEHKRVVSWWWACQVPGRCHRQKLRSRPLSAGMCATFKSTNGLVKTIWAVRALAELRNIQVVCISFCLQLAHCSRFPQGTADAERAGQPILQWGLTATFCTWKGDLEARVSSHDLRERQYRSSFEFN